MATNDLQPNWFDRVDITTATALTLQCPRCGEPYYIDPKFSNDVRQCNACQTRLAEWNLIHHIYLIDVDNAPLLIQKIVDHLCAMGANQADNELSELLNFLGVDLGI